MSTTRKPDPYGIDASPSKPTDAPQIKPAGGAIRPHDKTPDPYGLDSGKTATTEPRTGAAPSDEAAADAVAPAAVPDEAAPSSGRFTSQVMGGVHVITLTQVNVIDGRDIEQLGDEIYRHIKANDAPRLVLDLGNVQHLSSAALGMLIALKKVIDKRDGKLCLANVMPEILKIFKLTKLNKVLKIHDDTDKAIKSLL